MKQPERNNSEALLGRHWNTSETLLPRVFSLRLREKVRITIPSLFLMG